MKSNTDRVRLKALTKPDTPTDEHPETDIRHIVRGVVRRGLRPLPSKASISLRVDQDVLEWFKAQGPGCQTRINTVLRVFRDSQKALPRARLDELIEEAIVDAKAIRTKLGMTRQACAAGFSFSVNTLRHWELGTREPEGPTRAYLLAIERAPHIVEEALRIA